MSTHFDQYSDVIDSRDVVERMSDILDAIESGVTRHERYELLAERAELVSLYNELSNVGGDSPEDGQTLVRDSYFVNYAQELADDCGYEISDEWPYRCIDWALAARELQMDYTPVEFYGVTYWAR